MPPHLRADSPGLDFQPGDHICAFYNGGGNHLDDIVVDFVSKGLRSGDKCICFMDTPAGVRDRIPGELTHKDDKLQFDLYNGETVMYVLRTHTRIFVNGLIITNPYYIPKRQFLGGR
jgi:hypothetical protein